MVSSSALPKVLHADQEHSGLRSVIFVLLFVMLLAAFFGIRALLGALSPDGLPDYAFAISCGGAFPIALGAVWFVEQLLKQYWPSGRSITLTSGGVETKNEEDQTVQIGKGGDVAPLFWYFDLRGWQRGGRERRVPRNWLCLAVEIKEKKKQAIVYTYLSPQKAKRWLEEGNGRFQFHQIFPREVYDSSIRARMRGPSRPEIPTAVLTGDDGNYWLAERRRWTEGFELPPKEFEQFMSHIQAHLLEQQ